MVSPLLGQRRPPRSRYLRNLQSHFTRTSNKSLIGKVARRASYTGFDGSLARTVCVRLLGSTLYLCAHCTRFCGRYALSDRHLSNTEASIDSFIFSRNSVFDEGTGSEPISR